jgi:NADP-dependent 3-hydroxy acid dehydrogenase YdfG
MQALKGKSVLVTGASSGIGRASAKAFAREGMKVAVSARSTDRLLELLKELGPEAIMLPADLTSPAETDDLIRQAIAKLGKLDVLFANAGVYIAGQVADGDPAEWDRLLALNVGSVFRSINRVIPHMRANGGGDILVSSSISAYQTIHFEPVYSASKHALNAFFTESVGRSSKIGFASARSLRRPSLTNSGAIPIRAASTRRSRRARVCGRMMSQRRRSLCSVGRRMSQFAT